jgi:nitrogenase molybdenum-iron protein alpha/beta subunit
MTALLESSPYGKGCHVWINKDLWHLRSLLMTDPVDAMIGDTHGKFASRDAKIPLIRVGFPIIDRVNLHRYPGDRLPGGAQHAYLHCQQVSRHYRRNLRGPAV